MSEKLYSVEELQKLLEKELVDGLYLEYAAPAIAQQLIECLTYIETHKKEKDIMQNEIEVLKAENENRKEAIVTLMAQIKTEQDRNDSLSNEICKQDDEKKALKSKVDKLKTALEFYGDFESWDHKHFHTWDNFVLTKIGQDTGHVAREALSQIREVEDE